MRKKQICMSTASNCGMVFFHGSLELQHLFYLLSSYRSGWIKTWHLMCWLVVLAKAPDGFCRLFLLWPFIRFLWEECLNVHLLISLCPLSRGNCSTFTKRVVPTSNTRLWKMHERTTRNRLASTQCTGMQEIRLSILSSGKESLGFYLGIKSG